MNARQQWLDERRKGVGSSDAAGVIGVSPWTTQLKLYLDKRGELPEAEQNLPQEMGQLFEPVIIELFRRRTGKQVTVGNSIQNLVSARNTFMRANLDGLVESEGRIVEAKMASSDEDWGEAGSDQVPLHYGVQAQHQMAVTDLNVVDFAVLFVRFGIRELQTYTVPRDDELIDMLTEREREFWQRVIDGNPPEPTTSEDIRLRWPVDTGLEVEATSDVAAACDLLAIAKAEVKRAEGKVEEFATEVQRYMADAAVLTWCGRTLATWKKAKDSLKIDAERLAIGHPDLVKQYSVPKPGSRRFLLK